MPLKLYLLLERYFFLLRESCIPARGTQRDCYCFLLFFEDSNRYSLHLDFDYCWPIHIIRELTTPRLTNQIDYDFQSSQHN